jgi:hypothetical protein
VRFFGIEFEAQGVFFVVDNSGTFDFALARAKREVVSTISTLTEDFEIAIFLFSGILLRWPADGMPAKATEENKTAAVTFVESGQRARGTCPDFALLQALECVRRSSVDARAIFYVSDGGATCDGRREDAIWPETIDAVTAANNGIAAIHAIQLTGPDGSPGEQYLRELAEKNGGTFHQLDL